MSSYLPLHSPRRGTAMILMVILSVVMSGLVMALAWAAGIHTQIANQTTKLDKTFFAAEAAANRIIWYVKNNKIGTITSPQTGTINGCNYSVSWTNSSGTYAITGSATNGVVSDAVTLTCAATMPYSLVTVGGGGSTLDIKNMTINGNIQTNGNISSTTGQSTISGNVTYGGTANISHMTVSGSVSSGTSTIAAPNYAVIQAAATLTLTGNQTNHTFDFTSASVIYVNGSVTNPSFIGAGTLLISGSLTDTNGQAYGSPTNLIYVVVEGNANFNGTFDMYGGIYAGGNLDFPTKLDYLFGSLYCCGNATSTINHGTIDPGTKPWFDTRNNSGGTVSITNFTGTMP